MTTLKTILLDPGHGADTPGKRSPNTNEGFREYSQVRDIAFRLMQDYCHDYRFICPLLFHDVDLGLLKRVYKYNQIDCDLFISLHTNASPAIGWSSASGAVSFYRDDKSKQAATRFLKTYAENNDMRNRKARQNRRFTILKTKHTGFLIELGFHTNKSDCKKLKDLDKTAYAIKTGIDAVFEEMK